MNKHVFWNTCCAKSLYFSIHIQCNWTSLPNIHGTSSSYRLSETAVSIILDYRRCLWFPSKYIPCAYCLFYCSASFSLFLSFSLPPSHPFSLSLPFTLSPSLSLTLLLFLCSSLSPIFLSLALASLADIVFAYFVTNTAAVHDFYWWTTYTSGIIHTINRYQFARISPSFTIYGFRVNHLNKNLFVFIDGESTISLTLSTRQFLTETGFEKHKKRCFGKIAHNWQTALTKMENNLLIYTPSPNTIAHDYVF